MDFHTLTRKALQALCKQNGIPANLTNVAMADSLAALHHVEGLEELLNQSPEKIMIGSASVSRTAARTTTRRATAKKVVVEEEDQGKIEVPLKTPAAPITRRRASAASACQKMEDLTETTVKRAYSTRRSVRLLGKTMSKMSLDKDTGMTSSIDELSADTMDCSDLFESSVVKVDASEVLSELKSEGKTTDDSPTKESGMESEDCAPKTSSDALINSEVMDESSEESSADVKVIAESYCEEAQDLGKDANVIVAAQSAALQQVYEPQSAVETVELISLTISSTPTKSQEHVAATTTEASGDYNGKFDFESGSNTEGDSEDEGAEDESVDEASSELQNHITEEIREASEEGDSDDESTEGECSEEEDSDDINEEDFSEEVESAKKSLIAESNMSEAAVVEPSSPLAVNIATQFPRLASVKSSAKQRAEIIADDTEMEKDDEHKEVVMEKEDEAIRKEEIVEKFEAKSLRQLKKLLKLNMEKLTIEDSKDTEVVEKPRIALKEVPENQMIVKQN